VNTSDDRPRSSGRLEVKGASRCFQEVLPARTVRRTNRVMELAWRSFQALITGFLQRPENWSCRYEFFMLKERHDHTDHLRRMTI